MYCHPQQAARDTGMYRHPQQAAHSTGTYRHPRPAARGTGMYRLFRWPQAIENGSYSETTFSNNDVKKSHGWLYFDSKGEKERAGHKPGSVVDNHSSGTVVADCL